MKETMITIGTGHTTEAQTIGVMMIIKTGMCIPVTMKEIIGRTAILN